MVRSLSLYFGAALLFPTWLVLVRAEEDEEPCSLSDFPRPRVVDWEYCCQVPANANRGSCARTEPPPCLQERTDFDELRYDEAGYDEAGDALETCCGNNDDPDPACHFAWRVWSIAFGMVISGCFGLAMVWEDAKHVPGCLWDNVNPAQCWAKARGRGMPVVVHGAPLDIQVAVPAVGPVGPSLDAEATDAVQVATPVASTISVVATQVPEGEPPVRRGP